MGGFGTTAIRPASGAVYSPVVPGRRHYALAAAAALALAVYGSLVPLHYTARSFGEAVEAFRQIPYLSIGPGGRADWVSNILLFVPLGYLWLAAFTVDVQRSWVRVSAAVAVAASLASLAVTVEFTQLWFPPRTVSQNDIIAEAIGGAAGTLLWLGTGQSTAEWLRAVARTRRRSDRFVQLLQVYLVGFIAYAILPLDLTISSGDLLDKLRNGRLVLVPFSDMRADAESAYGLVRDVVVFFPIGILLSRWRTPENSPVRSLGITTLLGALVAGAIELSQVFVLTRYASTTDVVMAAVSAFGAAVVMQRWAGSSAGTSTTAGPASRHGRYWLCGALVWAVVIVVIFCAPFDVSGSSQEWRARYEGIWAVPFSGCTTQPSTTPCRTCFVSC